MGTPRQKLIGTAAILAIVTLVGLLLLARGSGDAHPTDDQAPRTTAGAAETQAQSPPASSIGGAEGHTIIEPERTAEHTSDTFVFGTTNKCGPATVEVHVHFAVTPDLSEERAVTLRARDELSGLIVSQAQCRGRGPEAIGYLDVPPNQWNQIEAVFDGALVPGKRLHLGPEERHRVNLQCGAQPTLLRVVGPSPQLAPWLPVRIVDFGRGESEHFVIWLDADGTAACHLVGAFRADVVGSHTITPLTRNGSPDLQPLAGTLDLVPDEPLIGIAVLYGGRAVAARVALEPVAGDYVERMEPERRCTVVPRAAGDAAESVQVFSEAIGDRRGSADVLLKAGDLWSLEVNSLQQLGRLHIKFDGTPMTATLPPLVAAPLDGGRSVPLAARDSIGLPPGDYRIVWAPHGAELEAAAEFVRIVAGETTELELTPRSLDRWTVRAPGVAEGSRLYFLESHSLSVVGDGEFVIDLGRAPRVGEVAEIESEELRALIPATFVAVDSGTRHAEVASSTEGLLWTRIVPVPLRNRDMSVRFDLTGTHVRTGGLFRGDRLPMRRDTRRRGHVIERIDGSEQVTCWFEVAAGTPELRLEPRGRWATLTFVRDVGAVRVTCIGPGGRLVKLRLQPKQGSTPFYVAEGTTAIHVETGGVRQAFDPTLTEFVVR